MLEDLTVDAAVRARVLRNPIESTIKWGIRRVLRWVPTGSIVLAFPSGDTMRFGRPGNESEPFLRFRNYRSFAKIIRGGAIGFAEAYMDGDIDCSDLTGLFRFFLRNRADFEHNMRMLSRARRIDRLAHQMRRNSRRGSRRNIAEHYDLGNAFYRLWLDPTMLYSSGLYADGIDTLEEAQTAKLQRILDLLDLAGGEKILEVGSGWGAFAIEAAATRAASVTGLTLSHEQLAHARERTRDAGLDAACDFRLQDYRDVTGTFDRIVSIEMIEAVGEAYWPQYFTVLRDRLKPGGTAVIQAITIKEERFGHYRNSTDFIQRHVFPGGMLPTPGIMETQAKAAGLTLDLSERFGLSYARTLHEWARRFEAAWPEITKLGFDGHFRRRWRYYLAYCEAGFLEGAVDVGFYRLRKPS
ncbi:cyclopropane-fatty-acyl-phospholipid synthase [Breoghania corrubedonensis]|uniref:Cyclopropane-fatty-acyl-phospholipid synthase n=1 Tax=Breoghania corrubedonensis TaxID=665038 RepID=A0A2T5USA9_9HYPH|nr:cyclopropane-fatty-acyl-phospholipid synthase family protein [Breoghania corrubedonensis]PTW54331.1 cyclopropane-fatty-acyl-phospholipid synthase [Breoghania corrubedonensis]